MVAHGVLRDLQDDGRSRDIGSSGESLGMLDAEYVESAQAVAGGSRGNQYVAEPGESHQCSYIYKLLAHRAFESAYFVFTRRR